MATNPARANRGDEFTIVGLVAFLAVSALFVLVSAAAGTRGLGILMIGSAFVQYRAGRIPYGVEGEPPAGHIKGWLATILSLLFVAFGIVLIVWPEVAIGMFGWSKT